MGPKATSCFSTGSPNPNLSLRCSLLCMGSHIHQMGGNRSKGQTGTVARKRNSVFMDAGCLTVQGERRAWPSLYSEEGDTGFSSLSNFLEGTVHREPPLYTRHFSSAHGFHPRKQSAQHVVLKPECLHQRLACGVNLKGGVKKTRAKTRSPFDRPINVEQNAFTHKLS